MPALFSAVFARPIALLDSTTMNAPLSSLAPSLKRSCIGLGTALALLASSTSFAAPPLPSVSAAKEIPAHLQLTTPSEEVTITVSEGRLIELKTRASKVLIADPRIASFQVPAPDRIFVFAQRAGTTTLYALDENDRPIAAIRVQARLDLPSLKAQLERQLPEVASRIELEPTLDSRVIVRGVVRTALEARQVLDYLQAQIDGLALTAARASGQTPPARPALRQGDEPAVSVINQLQVQESTQINIQVRVVEVSRSLSHQLGFNWSTVLNSGSGAYGIMTGNASSAFNRVDGVTSSMFDAVTGRNFANLIPGTSTAGLAAGGMVTRGRFTLGNLISALSTEGFATLLAEPNLTALSGESASFAVGGEVPIVIPNGFNVQLEYKSYGVILRMTPTLLSSNRISLHVAPEVSELSEEGAVNLQGMTIPAFKVRRADTTVELASGQSFALAGMLRSTTAQSISGVPGLTKIPVLGRMFEQETSEKSETELVIMVTANVVNPVTAADLQVPGQGMSQIDEHMPPQAAIGYLY